MLGFLLLYFIWKYYSELAFEYEKSKWGYVILGIATYYLGTFAGGFLIGMIIILMGSDIDAVSDILLSVMAVPFGILSVWGLYKFLQKKWSKKTENSNSESLDSDLI
ncbi:MAG: hypothetical protein HY062_06935 [Bacteroidetes bacterium]|nr:hypothetical protein [Bacteroidota bacterium]